MEQFKFDFGQQDSRIESDKSRQIRKFSEVYLINAPDGELITIGHNFQGKQNKVGESYVA